MGVVMSYLASPALYVPFVGLVGVVGGLWVDTALKFYEAMKGTPKEVDWPFLEDEIIRIKSLVSFDIQRSPDVEGGYFPISQETVTSFYALLFYLNDRKLAPADGMPSPSLANDPDLFFEISSRYLTAIEPFVKAKDARGISAFGKIAVDMVYDWDNERKADKIKSESLAPQPPQKNEA